MLPSQTELKLVGHAHMAKQVLDNCTVTPGDDSM